MTDYTQRAIRNEAGHATAALHLGFPMHRIYVKAGFPFADVSLNSTRKKLRCQWCDFDGVSEAVKAVYESQYLFAFFPAVEAVRA